MKLTREVMDLVRNNERLVDSILDCMNEVKCFKLHDVLIAYRYFRFNDMELVTNSYGIPRKYKVIHVDKNGIPYVKELNKSSNPSGPIIPCVMYQNDQGKYYASMVYKFEVDPDMADAIILDDLENFNPSQIHAEKLALRNDIVKHNRQNKLKFTSLKQIINFSSNLQSGTVLWRSVKLYWTLISKRPIRNQITLQSDFDLEFQDSKGRRFIIPASDLIHKNLYTNQPRSFKELKDPK